MFWLECISPHRQRRFKMARCVAGRTLYCVNSNGKDLVSDGEKTVDIYQTSFYTNHVKKTRGACVPG